MRYHRLLTLSAELVWLAERAVLERLRELGKEEDGARAPVYFNAQQSNPIGVGRRDMGI